MKLKHNQTTLSLLINKEHENYGFISSFIYGYQGVGKTTYALKTLYYVYNDWDKALQHTFFDFNEAFNMLKKSFMENKRIKAILIDDAGYSLIKYDWRKDHAQLFSKFFNLARTVVTGIIFTSIQTTDIINFVRQKIMYPVNVRRIDNKYSEARGYKIYMTPLMERIPKRFFRDIFIRRLPNDVYKQYEEERRKTLTTLFGITERKLDRELEEIVKSWSTQY